MSNYRERFTAARDALLADITAFLKHDSRFLAAWLAGSFGRGEQTWLSDLDLHVVVVEEYSEQLCSTSGTGAGRTTPERLALFRQFGTPTIIFEAHANNTMGGTFTYVAYSESAQSVDWMLIPQPKAHLEHPSLLLFDKVGIPAAPEPEPLTREQAIEAMSDAISFFWMIAAEAAREIEEDLIHFHVLLLWLRDSIRKVKYALEYKELPFARDWPEVCYTFDKKAAALRQLCGEMEQLAPAVIAFGGSVPPTESRVVVEKRLALFEDQ